MQGHYKPNGQRLKKVFLYLNGHGETETFVTDAGSL